MTIELKDFNYLDFCKKIPKKERQSILHMFYKKNKLSKHYEIYTANPDVTLVHKLGVLIYGDEKKQCYKRLKECFSVNEKEIEAFIKDKKVVQAIKKIFKKK